MLRVNGDTFRPQPDAVGNERAPPRDFEIEKIAVRFRLVVQNRPQAVGFIDPFHVRQGKIFRLVRQIFRPFQIHDVIGVFPLAGFRDREICGQNRFVRKDLVFPRGRDLRDLFYRV